MPCGRKSVPLPASTLYTIPRDPPATTPTQTGSLVSFFFHKKILLVVFHLFSLYRIGYADQSPGGLFAQFWFPCIVLMGLIGIQVPSLEGWYARLEVGNNERAVS